MNAAPVVQAVTNVTAFLGERFEPRLVDLHLRDGKIASTGEPARPGPPPRATNGSDAPAPRTAGGRVLDGTGLFAVPGFYDLHDHFRFLTPGLEIGEGLKLDEFLRVMWTTGQQMGVAEYNLGARLLTLQRLKMGLTTVVDHCYTFHAHGLDEARALVQLKRADLAVKNVDAHEPAALERLSHAIEEQRDSPHRLADLAVNGSDLIAVGFREGPALGAALARLLDEVLEDPANNDRETLLARARELAG